MTITEEGKSRQGWALKNSATSTPFASDSAQVDIGYFGSATVVLFSDGFYSACRRALRDEGVFVSQTGSPIFQTDEFQMAYGNLSASFGSCEPYLSFVPTYPGTLWSYMSATDGPALADGSGVAARLSARGVTCKLYSEDVHRGAFALPPFVQELCETAKPVPIPRG